MSIFKFILRHFRVEALGREVEEELRFHIEMRTRGNIAAGMSPEDAKADALRRFGDFEHVKSECSEIRREKLMGGVNMKVMRGIAWVMLGCGLTLIITGEFHTVRQAGQMLVCIAVFWWLLLYLRATRPDQQRINQHLEAAEQTILNLTAPVGGLDESAVAEPPLRQVAPRDDLGRTPVERLLAEDERLP